MIIGYSFEGDDHKDVKDIQHDYYGGKVFEIFDVARERYLFAERCLDHRTEAGRLVLRLDGIDHRVLQATHDQIAARFRFYMRVELDPLLPFADGMDHESRILNLWEDFFLDELRSCASSPEFVRNVVFAVAYANSEKGYEAEDVLYNWFKDRYESMYSYRADQDT